MKLHSLDLHGVRHKDVHTVVDRFIGAHIFERKTNSVQIITGNSSKMKRLVNKTLSEYNLNVKQDFFNSGCTIVSLL